MAWSTANDRAGTGLPGVIYDTKLVAIGTINRFVDPIYGEGDFIFLPGVAALVAGDVVEYTSGNGAASPTGSVTRWAGTAGTGKPLAVASVANILTTNWSWYQLTGLAVINTSGAVAAGNPLYWQATATLSATLVAGKQFNNASPVSANGVPSANKTTVQIFYPFGQGNIT